MAVIPPQPTTLNVVVFMANLIDLKQFNTILVLHDHTTGNQINLLIEILSSRYDVTWLLINEYDHPIHWNHSIYQDQNQLILTALQSINIYPLLSRLYNNKSLLIRSKNRIVSCDISKFANAALYSLLQQRINVALVDWSRDEALIYTWNPYSARKYRLSIWLRGCIQSLMEFKVLKAFSRDNTSRWCADAFLRGHTGRLGDIESTF